MGVRGLTSMLAAALLLGALACSKSEPAAPPAPAPPAPPKAGPEATEPATPAAPKPASPARMPKRHSPKTELPPPPEGRIWVTGTVNRLSGIMRPRTTVNDVCVYEHDDVPCVETDDAGYFEIAVPRNQQVALLFRGDELTPTLRPLVTGDEAIKLGNTRVANSAGFDGIAKAIGVENPPGTGGIFFSGVEGTTATLEPPSGTRFFLKYGDAIDAEATGVPMRGSGGFLGVKPGKTKIRFKHSDGPCRFRDDNMMGGWPDPKDPGVAVVPVLAGHHVHMTTMYCGKDVNKKTPSQAKPPSSSSTEPPATTKEK